MIEPLPEVALWIHEANADERQAEIRSLCDTAAATGLNALILQVRTSTDALYESKLEPWSEYLTGTQGQHPGYDPLAVWITEAKARGLELHAWFNPYRSRHSTAKSAVADSHVSRTHPEWVKRYGDQLWIDPGEPAAAEHTLAVCRDLLSRYAVDGLHIDDYFYPYPVQDAARQEVDFPDELSWSRYLSQSGRLTRPDWRRENVDRLVERLHALVRELRPAARVGISPFGLGRPDRRPAGISGFSQYDKLFADVERWLEEGWMDYLAPQLYWPIDRKEQAFEVLLDYWLAQNRQSRHVWPGLYTSRVGAATQPWSASEVVNQIAVARSRAASTGQVHFSMAALMKDADGIATALKKGPYAQAALVPTSPWLNRADSGASAAPPTAPPLAPKLRLEGSQLRILPTDASPPSSMGPVLWTLWSWRESGWQLQIQPRQQNVWRLPAGVTRGTGSSAHPFASRRA